MTTLSPRGCASRRIVGPAALAGLLLACTPPMPERFEWLPAVSTPYGFPVAVTSGTVRLTDGSTIPLSLGGVQHGVWGQASSIELLWSLAKPLPTSVEAEWFSLREDRFYRVLVPLETARVEQLFKERSFHPRLDSSPSRDRLVVGFAPSGHMAIWVAGVASTELLTSARGEVAMPEWSTRFPSSSLSREEFVSLNLEELGLSATAPPMPEPPDLWAQAERRIVIRLLTAGIAELELLSIRALNGEFAFISPGAALFGDGEERALPSVIEVQWRGHDQVRRAARLELNSAEVLAASSRLMRNPDGSGAEARLTLSLDLSEAPRTATIALASDVEIVPMQRTSLSFTRLP